MNQQRLQAILDFIRQNPDRWDQTQWHSPCGSSHCLAGHAQLAAGLPADNYLARAEAKAYLGLEHEEAEWLFAGERTLSQLERACRTGQCLIYDEAYGPDGFDPDGFDRDGCDRDGYDCQGYDVVGYDRDGFDREGYDADGYDRDGL
jgi:hypothetical protein